jgi:hypothetical protein
MSIITYALFSYLITAVISFAVIGVIVAISKLLSSSNAS